MFRQVRKAYYDDPLVTPPVVVPPPVKTFTQEEVNAIAAKERKAAEDRAKKLATDLEALKQSQNLSEQEKEVLNAKISELEKQYLTTEQLAAQTLEKEKKVAKEQQEQLVKDRDAWKTNYTTSMIRTEILAGASNSDVDAVNPNQMYQLLQHTAKVVDKLGPDGKPTGETQVVLAVTIPDAKDKTKTVTVELPVVDALKQLKGMPADYGNLFKSTIKGGLGSGNNGRVAPIDIPSMSMEEFEQYRKQRKKS